MDVGLLRETTRGERRVALTPSIVHKLLEKGHRILIEQGAGERAHYLDQEYVTAGATLVYSPTELIDRSELLVKVGRPSHKESERLHERQTVMAFFHMATADRREVQHLLANSVTTIGYEVIETNDGRLPVLESISEIAGQMVVAIAAHLLRSTSGGRGILLGGAPAIPPAKVLILGAGVVGTWAARTAVSAGAVTLVLDSDLNKLRRLMVTVPGVVTSLADADTLREAVRQSDVLIGAVLLRGERAPHLVTREMVESMQPGSVIIDVSIDQGGCVETSRPTTLDDPVFVHQGIVHYCVPNMTADIARTASAALAQASLPHILEIAQHGLEAAVLRSPELARGVYTYRGQAAHSSLAARWNLPHRDVLSLIGEAMPA